MISLLFQETVVMKRNVAKRKRTPYLSPILQKTLPYYSPKNKCFPSLEPLVSLDPEGLISPSEAHRKQSLHPESPLYISHPSAWSFCVSNDFMCLEWMRLLWGDLVVNYSPSLSQTLFLLLFCISATCTVVILAQVLTSVSDNLSGPQSQTAVHTWY